jgi:hypothetical protein
MFMSDLYVAQARLDDLNREIEQAIRLSQARQASAAPPRRPILRLLGRRRPAPAPQSRAA